MNVSTGLSNRWLRLTLVLALVLLGAFCFLRYIGWAFAHSGSLGLGSRIREAQLARDIKAEFASYPQSESIRR